MPLSSLLEPTFSEGRSVWTLRTTADNPLAVAEAGVVATEVAGVAAVEAEVASEAATEAAAVADEVATEADEEAAAAVVAAPFTRNRAASQISPGRK